MQNTPNKAVIFDFFGVIGDEIAWSWYRANKHRTSIHETELADLLRVMDVGLITPDDMFGLLSKKSGLPTREIKNDMQGKSIQIDKNVVAIIQKLKNKYKIGLLSNAHREWLEKILKDNSLLNYFDHISISSDLGFAKPDREVFEITLRKLEVLPQDAYFIDDTEKNIIAAEKLGINTIHFLGAKKLEEELSLAGLLD